MRVAHRCRWLVLLVIALGLVGAATAKPGHGSVRPPAVMQGHSMTHVGAHYPYGHGYRGFHGFYSMGYWNGCGPSWDWSWGPTGCSPWGWGPYYGAGAVWPTAQPVQWVVTTPVAPAARGIPSPELYVYPRKGQSDEQLATDRYECHKWATTQVQFDPTRVDEKLSAQEASAKREDYTRALSACLTGRGYSVK